MKRWRYWNQTAYCGGRDNAARREVYDWLALDQMPEAYQKKRERRDERENLLASDRKSNLIPVVRVLGSGKFLNTVLHLLAPVHVVPGKPH